MATGTEEWITTLKTLFESCKDGEKGFRLAAEQVKDSKLTALFRDYAEQRAQFAAELQGELERLGTHDWKDATVGGALHQGWMRIKNAVMGGSARALLAECERGEDVARKDFEEALKHDLPPGVEALLRHQLTAVQKVHDCIRALELAAAE